jgi:hypothetical protein
MMPGTMRAIFPLAATLHRTDRPDLLRRHSAKP